MVQNLGRPARPQEGRGQQQHKQAKDEAGMREGAGSRGACGTLGVCVLVHILSMSVLCPSASQVSRFHAPPPHFHSLAAPTVSCAISFTSPHPLALSLAPLRVFRHFMLFSNPAMALYITASPQTCIQREASPVHGGALAYPSAVKIPLMQTLF